MKSEMPFGAFRRVRQPRENEMNDILGHVVLAEGDEDLLPGKPVMLAVGYGFRANLREVRTRLRLGEAHRACPFSGDEIGDESSLLFVRAHQLDRFDRTLIEQRSVCETDVGGVPHFERRAEKHLRQTLSAVFVGNRQADPSGVGEFFIGLFEAFRRRDRTVVQRAAFFVGDAIERIEHARRKRRGFFQNRVEHVERLFAARKRRTLSTSASSRKTNCMSRTGAR